MQQIPSRKASQAIPRVL